MLNDSDSKIDLGTKTAQGDPGRFEQIVARRGIDAKNRKRWKQELPKEN